MEQLKNNSVVFTRKGITDTYFVESLKSRYINSPTLGKNETYILEQHIDFLNNPSLIELANWGQITFAAIKPKTHESKLNVKDDIEGEKRLLEMVKDPLKIIFKVSLSPSPEDFEKFYPQEVIQKLKIIPEYNSNAWDSFLTHLTSGPITYFLIYDPDSRNAVKKWREFIGATNPQKAHPESIRGKYANSIANNLIHGSSDDDGLDGIINVESEIKWLSDTLGSILINNKTIYHNIFEDDLKTREIIGKNDSLIASKRILSFKQFETESFHPAHAIVVRRYENGEIITNYTSFLSQDIVPFEHKVEHKNNDDPSDLIDYDPIELGKLIYHRPINEDTIVKILTSKKTKVFFTHLKSDIPASMSMYLGEIKIFISSGEEKDQKVYLLHELLHAHYKVRGIRLGECYHSKFRGTELDEERSKCEDLLTQEAQRICTENPDLVDKYFYMLKKQNGNNMHYRSDIGWRDVNRL